MRPALALLAFALPCLAGPEESAVHVTVTTGATVSGGSGTVVRASKGESLILTNRHVAPDRRGVCAVETGRLTIPAVWVGADDVADLALLSVAVELPAVSLAAAEPPNGTVLRQWGYPFGKRTAKSGPAIGADGSRVVGGSEIYYAGFEPEPGDSGAGLLNPAGELVAVNWGGRWTKRENCVRLSDVRRFLSPYVK